MSFFKSHRGAVVVAVLVIAFSVLFGAHRSLVSVRGDVLTVYELGANADGHSVSADLDVRASTCANLYKVAAKYLDEESAEMQALKAAYTLAQSEGADRRSADQALDAAAQAVYVAMSGQPVTEQDTQYVSGFLSELSSRAFSIANDPYNAMAFSFNHDVLGSFPANLLRYAVFVEPLPVFHY